METQLSHNDWQKLIKNHLIDYKTSLGIIEDGYDSSKKAYYSHVFPNECGYLNYLVPEIKEYVGNALVHPGWRHLNSSQTMCWNFFAPMIKNNYYLLNKFLNLVLKKNNIEIIDAKFEYSLKSTFGKATEFDFWCVDKDKHHYYFEIKYTENDISKTSKAKDKKRIFENIYKPLIVEGSYFTSFLENEELFMSKHFQAYRNMIMANKATCDYCFFITMKGNRNTYNELKEAITDLRLDFNSIENDPDSTIRSLYWENIVDDVRSLCPQFDKHIYDEFSRKYLPKEK